MKFLRARGASRRACALFVAAALMGCAGPAPGASPLAAAPPVPPNEARIWFYRVFFPGDTPTLPAVAINGTTIGYGSRGASFYRDVRPGDYHITVASHGRDVGQSASVDLSPGRTVFVKIASAPQFDEDEGAFNLGTYYARVVVPQLATQELAETRFTGGS